MGRRINAIIARRLRFASRRYAYGKHTLGRIKDRYGENLTNDDLLRMADMIYEQRKGVICLKLQSNGKFLYMLTYKKRQYFLVYDAYHRRIVTALPESAYFKRIKLLEDDKEAILSGVRKTIIYISSGLISMKKGRILKLYVVGSKDPFAEVIVTGRQKVKVKDFLAHAHNYPFTNLEELLKYMRDRYGDKITEDTYLRVGAFKEVQKLG